MKKVHLEIHQTRKFAKRLVAMAKAGKHERIVADRARQILADLHTHPLHEEAECKRTRHGELRLNDCRKYDLSCGFRLIALKRDRRLIFTYVGSHDDCQRWIENNRYSQDEIKSMLVPPIAAENLCQSEMVIEVGPDNDDDDLLGEIDERVLREIFSGLCNNG